MTLVSLIGLTAALAFLFLVLSLFCSLIQEFYEQRSGIQSKQFRIALQRMIRDRWFYMAIIKHPSIASLYREISGRSHPPSYVPLRNFADAAVDALVQRARSLAPEEDRFDGELSKTSLMRAAEVCENAGYSFGEAIRPHLAQTVTLQDAKESIGRWYELEMNGVKTRYKRRLQQNLFLICFVLAVMFNIDSINIAFHMSSGNYSAPKGDAGFIDLMVPIGYDCFGNQPGHDNVSEAILSCISQFETKELQHVPFRIVGWLITAAAASFGAEFWYGWISRFIAMRSSVSKTKSD